MKKNDLNFQKYKLKIQIIILFRVVLTRNQINLINQSKCRQEQQ
jgi:hypothetical protein